jgi:hypothetical protein
MAGKQANPRIRGVQRRVMNERNQEIWNLYELEGWSQRDIAIHIGIAQSRVSDIIRVMLETYPELDNIAQLREDQHRHVLAQRNRFKRESLEAEFARDRMHAARMMHKYDETLNRMYGLENGSQPNGVPGGGQSGEWARYIAEDEDGNPVHLSANGSTVHYVLGISADEMKALE